MALTIAETKRGVVGNLRYWVGTVAFDTSYPTGGESFKPVDIGWDSFFLVFPAPTKGVTFEFDYTNNKVLAYVPGVTAGAAGALVLDDFPIGTGLGATAVSMGLTAGGVVTRFGVEKEVADTTDLSTITGVRVIVFGI